MTLSVVGTLLAFRKNPGFVSSGFLLLRVLGLPGMVRLGLFVSMHQQIIMTCLPSFRPLFLSFLVESVGSLLSLRILMLSLVVMRDGVVMVSTLLQKR